MFPMRVYAIVEDGDEANTQPVILAKHYCRELGIPFILREYNPTKYKEDRDNIMYTPAFHVFQQKTWEDTFHWNDDDVVQKLNFAKEALEYRLQRQERRRQKWIRRLPILARFLKLRVTH
jgi:hypothetical protein